MNRRMLQHIVSLLGASSLALASVAPAMAEQQTCQADTLCKAAAQQRPLGKNTEVSAPPEQKGTPVSISVDGETVFGSPSSADKQRRTDVSLEQVDIQVKFDGLGVKPMLNVSTWPIRRTYKPNEEIAFLASTNYPGWIDHSELRIFERRGDLLGKPLYAVPVSRDGLVHWRMPADGPGDLVYILRVVDRKGRFDETTPLSIAREQDDLPQHATTDDKEAVAPGYGEDRTAFRNIPVYGGAITVVGANVPAEHAVSVLGASIPVDDSGAFVVQQILPPGEHDIDVAVIDRRVKDGSKGIVFDRKVSIPKNEWFYVGLADFTVGKSFGSKHIKDVHEGEYDKVYTRGRLAFYLKGKIQGKYLLTAAADTRDRSIKDMFKGLDRKDPRQFLDRIDPEEFYPIYGDDSEAVLDAPTRGKFYVRLDKGLSHVMWGNFRTQINGTTYLRNERALYGLDAVYRSEKTTKDGEQTTEVKAYVAHPGTMPEQDVFRGTGGSAYFLSHQDLTIGSETLAVELRDPVTRRVLTRRTLRVGFDYEIDYFQGLVLLKSALGSSASAEDVVRNESTGGARQYLVANYEYAPAARDIGGASVGGRVHQWIGNNVRVGVSGMREKTGPADQKMAGADLLIRKSQGTFIEGEYGYSRGRGFGVNGSLDGGYEYNDAPTAGRNGQGASAYRGKARIDFSEFIGSIKGEAGGYVEHKQGGFSSLDDQIYRTQTTWGADAKVEVTDNVKAKVKFDSLTSDDGRSRREGDADIGVAVTDKLTITPGVKVTENRDRWEDRRRDNGWRTDVGAEARYTWDDTKSAYVYGQVTADRSGGRHRNDRVGAGGTLPVTEKIGLYGELSEGSRGVGAKAGIDYRPTADDHYYLGYKLDPDRFNAVDDTSPLLGNDMGVVVVGARKRYSERIAVYAEDSYDLFGYKRTLGQTYGVEYTPSSKWKMGAGLEVGHVFDDNIDNTTGYERGVFRRVAVSGTVSYRDEHNTEAKLRGEVRHERSDDHHRDRNTYLVGAGGGTQVSPNWRLLANLDTVISNASDDLVEGRYLESWVGYAYRPVDNDRLNALLKYSFLYDKPGRHQDSIDGTREGRWQKSHILSADVTYDLNRLFTVGAKYGFRLTRAKERYTRKWYGANAQIGIARVDFHIVNNWDALAEGRVLWNKDGAHYGALAAIYRQVNENFKVGIGYNFGRFSDDLRDLSFNDNGIFFNAIGQF